MAKALPVSPLAPAQFPDLPVIGGVRFATVAAGVRYSGRTDVMLALLDSGTSVAGVFTRSATRSAPVLDCQAKIGGHGDGPGDGQRTDRPGPGRGARLDPGGRASRTLRG